MGPLPELVSVPCRAAGHVRPAHTPPPCGIPSAFNLHFLQVPPVNNPLGSATGRYANQLMQALHEAS